MIRRSLAIPALAIVLFASFAEAQSSAPRTVHVLVALADNQHQGIVPVAAKLGNGDDPERNLYWGSAYGVKTFFSRSPEWGRISCSKVAKPGVLERCIFRYRTESVYLIADAYRGVEIKQAIQDFFESAAGAGIETITVDDGSGALALQIRGGANLVAYIGHDGLMDFPLSQPLHRNTEGRRDAIVLACASKQFFSDGMRASGAYPLLWTTGLMAPEAYTLKSALDGWIAAETNEQIRNRAADAYDKYQKCGIRAARHLFATGW